MNLSEVPVTPVAAVFGTGISLRKADASFIGEEWMEHAGSYVACAGDVNGDGYDDVLVGAIWNNEGGYRAGQAYLILGNATIGNGCAKDMPLSAASVSFLGESADDWAGTVAGAGDVNGDGFDDILVGAWCNSEGGTYAGQAYLILGNATIGNGCAKDMRLGAADASFIGEGIDNGAGSSIAGAGDVNGDGYDDFLIGAWYKGGNTGQVYLILGNATIGNGCAKDMRLGAANASFIGEKVGDSAGHSVAGAGDVNGDGYDDFLVGAYQNDEGGSNTGQAYLILGNTTIGNGCAKDMRLGAANASFIGEVTEDGAGLSVAGVGDVNNDGWSDILIGAFQNDQGGSGAGQAYLILGNATIGNGCAKDMRLGAANASFIGEAAGDYAGYSVAGVGNVNGDGYGDFLIGGQGSGTKQAYLILGNATIGNGCAKGMRLSAASASFIGETAADYAGRSLTGAGNVNGDGYDDLLIGAEGNNEGADGAGQAYLFLGWDFVPIITGVGFCNGEVYGTMPPTFRLSFIGAYHDQQWYSFDGGATNITCGLSDTLIGWENLPNGSIVVSFWMNNTAGNVSARFDWFLRKDIIKPIITIITPAALAQFSNAPTCMLNIIEPNLHRVWYILNNNSKEHFFIGTSINIDAAEWGAIPNGAGTIHFFANDTAGNEHSVDVTIVKIISPWIVPTIIVTTVGVAVVVAWAILKNKRAGAKISYNMGTNER